MSRTEGPRRNGARWAALTVGLILVGGSAAWAALSPAPAAAPPSDTQTLAVEVDQVPLVCPPSVLDPLLVVGDGALAATAVTGTETGPQSGENPQSGGDAITVTAEAEDAVGQAFPDLAADPLQGGGTVRIIESQGGQHDLAGVFLAGVAEGDLLSLTAQTCTVPSRSLAFAAGATTVGEDTVLIISNPSDKPADVSVQIFGATGSLLSSPATLTVGGSSTVSVLPGTWSPGADSPAILVTTDGSGVGAWLQTSALDGEVPLGLDAVPGMTPETSVTLTGVSATRESTLRIGNLGPQRTEVTVSMLTEDGTEPLDGAQDLPVLAKSTVSVDLSGLPSDVHGIVVEGDQELVAMVTEATAGESHPDVRDATYFARTVVGGGRPLNRSPLISPSDLAELVDDLGFTDPTLSVAVSNPGDGEVNLEIQGASKRLPAHSAGLYPLIGADVDQQFTSDGPVYAAYVLTASTPAGTVRSVASLGVEGPLAQSRAVWLFPEAQVR